VPRFEKQHAGIRGRGNGNRLAARDRPSIAAVEPRIVPAGRANSRATFRTWIKFERFGAGSSWPPTMAAWAATVSPPSFPGRKWPPACRRPNGKRLVFHQLRSRGPMVHRCFEIQKENGLRGAHPGLHRIHDELAESAFAGSAPAHPARSPVSTGPFMAVARVPVLRTAGGFDANGSSDDAVAVHPARWQRRESARISTSTSTAATFWSVDCWLDVSRRGKCSAWTARHSRHHLPAGQSRLGARASCLHTGTRTTSARCLGLLKELHVPVWGTRFCPGAWCARKIWRPSASGGLRAETKIDPDRDPVAGGQFHRLSFYRVTHSILDAVGLIIDCPAGPRHPLRATSRSNIRRLAGPATDPAEDRAGVEAGACWR